jgi:hypothetical protein
MKVVDDFNVDEVDGGEECINVGFLSISGGFVCTFFVMPLLERNGSDAATTE